MDAADTRVSDLLLDSPRTIVGVRAAEVATEIVAEAAGTAVAPRVVLIAGGGFTGRGWSAPLLTALRSYPLRMVIQSGLPTPESVAVLARQVRAHRADVVLTVGGGSVMDAGKAAAALSIRTDPTPELVVRACAEETGGEAAPPVIALPTTPGTGAEATPFATIWHRGQGRKLSLRGASLRPVTAVLDPDLLIGLPEAHLISCLLDTLAQGLEGAWSIRADQQSEWLGGAAWALLADLLDRRPDDWGAAQRHAALLAGHLAGRAIALAGTTVCHAMSYPLTLRHGLGHGHACGLTLAAVLRYNASVGADCADPRGPQRVRATIARVVSAAGVEDVEELARRIDTLAASPALPVAPDLRRDAIRIATEALAYDRAGNNPRRVDVQALTRLLAGITERDYAR
ncbi:iron-containing alcohol dehydrogenase [Nocardia pseudobrasiliensis]|uniref:Phosphonoacetaldehyde reductase n=1 Tax=Nocardia pseudobrasiliensis TaxID=45979 RepID=A0A370I848_9NOCA|nr:iron-containing alcohol dehydrogenase [Nocardia pseudobrasiliensis]RDI65544.1 phosphonoacetaldehyde reductase [Nocardia pseudobrasiliensis]